MSVTERNHDDGAHKARFAELLQKVCEGELSSVDAEALRELLQEDEERRRAYLQTVHMMAGLRKWACSRGIGDIAELLSLAERTNYEAGVASGIRVGQRPTRFRLLAACGLAATVLVSATLWWPSGADLGADAARTTDGDLERFANAATRSLYVSDTQEIVARVVSVSSDIRWPKDAGPPDFLLRLRPGDLVAIESGVAQVEFTSGAELMLSGDCKLQITSPSSARLLRGMVVGQADGELDFTVVTPSATVVDVGTKFGVSVGESGTDVSVFDGEVHVHGLQATEAANGSVRKLREGMSVRVDRDGMPGNAPAEMVARLENGRKNLHRRMSSAKPGYVSLLDLLAGDTYRDSVVGGSIDAVTGFWGRHAGYSNDKNYAPWVPASQTAYRSTEWNPFIDGVFVPKPTGAATQYNSAGETIDLPASCGHSWGPIWSRRRLSSEALGDAQTAQPKDFWGGRSFEQATARMATSRDGLLGLHANVGVTFDLRAIRERVASGSPVMRFVGAITNLDDSQLKEPPGPRSLVDARFFVDGELRYSRSDFGRRDGEESFVVPLDAGDRFLTLAATDSDHSIHHDHVILIDPRIEPIDRPLGSSGAE